MPANLTRFSLLVSGAVLIGFFQNCGQNMRFEAQGVSSQKAGLVPVNTGEGNLGFADMPEDDDSKNPGGEIPNPVIPNPEVPTPETPTPKGPGAQVAMEYACILQGPGRSLRVGFTDGGLNSQTSVPRSVCMSEKACLKMASLKLAVKEAVLFGPCRNNPNVIHLNDEKIAELVGFP